MDIRIISAIIIMVLFGVLCFIKAIESEDRASKIFLLCATSMHLISSICIMADVMNAVWPIIFGGYALLMIAATINYTLELFSQSKRED